MLKSKNWLPLIFLLWTAGTAFSLPIQVEQFSYLKSDTSFPQILLYFFDFVTLAFLLVFFVFLFWHKKSFLAFINFLKKNRTIFSLGLLFSLFCLLSASWSGSSILSLVLGIRILLIFSAVVSACFLLRASEKYQRSFLLIIIFIGISQSLLGLYQFVSGQSLGLFWLGEGNLGKESLGLAKIWLGDQLFLRAYGTFSHPNILGGFQLFALFFTFQGFLRYPTFFARNTWLGIFIVEFLGLTLSFSRTALTGFIVIAIGLLWKKGCDLNWQNSLLKKIVILLISIASIAFILRGAVSLSFWHSESVQMRIELARANMERFKEAPLWGKGFGTGPVELTAYSDFPFYFFEKQPVHNIFILILADLGIFGLLLFSGFIFYLLKAMRKDATQSFWWLLFSVYLLIGLWDHYLITLPAGIFLLFFSAFGFLTEKNRPKQKIIKLAGKTEKPFSHSERSKSLTLNKE